MSSDIITLKLTERKELGKAAKTLLREGRIPANIYEKGKESQAVSADFAAITKAYRQAGKHSAIELDVDGKKHLAMIRDVDINIGKNTLRHIAFHAVNRNEKVEAEVSVKLKGEVPATRSGLLVLQNLDTVIVEAIPGDLPEELFIDGSKLVQNGDKVTVADIIAVKNVEIKSESDIMVFSVDIPRDQLAAANADSEDSAESDAAESDAKA